jgi:NAD-reducing hydrogenase large subunit
VHPHFAVPGGVNKALSVKERDYILGQLDEMISYVQEGIAVAKAWMADNQDLIDRFAVFSSGYMGMVLDDGGLNLYDGKLRMIDADGNRLEEFEGKDYLKHIGEHVEDWSYLKFPFYLKKGWPDGVYRVGPLGRLNAADSIPTPLAQEEFLQFKGLNGGMPVEGTLYFHYARLIEDLYSMERTRELLEDPDILSTDILATPKEIAGEGVGVIEAPRGTLFHHYWTDDQGVITKVNLIVATGHNNWAMNKSVEMVAKEFVDGNNLTEGMLNRVEGAIRAHDPCLSCSTHAVGQMPLVVELQAADGTLLDKLTRE